MNRPLVIALGDVMHYALLGHKLYLFNGSLIAVFVCDKNCTLAFDISSMPRLECRSIRDIELRKRTDRKLLGGEISAHYFSCRDFFKWQRRYSLRARHFR